MLLLKGLKHILTLKKDIPKNSTKYLEYLLPIFPILPYTKPDTYRFKKNTIPYITPIGFAHYNEVFC